MDRQQRQSQRKPKTDSRGQFIGRNVFLLYVGRIVAVAVTTVVMGIGIALSESAVGYVMAFVIGAAAGLLVFLAWMKFTWRD